MFSTKIIEEVDRSHFEELIDERKDSLRVSPHALDHLSNAQRKIFSEEDLKRIILSERPEGVGRQRNECYAVFYKRKDGYLKLILNIKEARIDIITFINVGSMPNLKRLSDGE
ncbi:TPA: hypothetical protein HA372_01770 [Candidatus Woesearchaeota archaeon]|nr:hypothetical protein [Candidatus Woesearchaeota archaeon]HIH04811.1 hypothetical protein [Candidatus Woesearchaeota archaeon]HIJ18396.1 hypothetical protein [Candidatus Woesearchaeota archaeon]